MQEVEFTTSLRVQEEEGGDIWRLLEPLIFVSAEQRYVVPSGFKSDFASIPRIFRSIIPVLGRQNKASVLHDYLIREEVVGRFEADRLFFEGMASSGVNKVKRNLMYAAVLSYTIVLYLRGRLE